MEQETLWIVIGVVVACTLLWIILVVCCCWWCRRKSSGRIVEPYRRFPEKRGCKSHCSGHGGSSIIKVPLDTDSLERCPHNKWARRGGGGLRRSHSMRSLPGEPNVWSGHVPPSPRLYRSNSLPRSLNGGIQSRISIGSPNPGPTYGQVHMSTDVAPPLRVNRQMTVPQTTATITPLPVTPLPPKPMTEFGALRQQLGNVNSTYGNNMQIVNGGFQTPMVTGSNSGVHITGVSLGGSNPNLNTMNTGMYSAVHHAQTKVYHGPTVAELPNYAEIGTYGGVNPSSTTIYCN